MAWGSARGGMVTGQIDTCIRRSSQAAFGSKGDMYNSHIQQFYYRIGWVHHEKPKFYQSMYTVLKLLNKELTLPQMWIDTR